MNRQEFLQDVAGNTDFDIIVIGGGATGLGIALEAATRGYRTLLLEQSDFAKSTSSKSTKLVHGGVRYLAQGNIKLVREASVERGYLLRNAPHLVRNIEFVIPVYSTFNQIKFTIGLTLYDWISGTLSLGSSYFISKTETLEKLPNIKTEGLAGGVVYHDGQFDDARLALNLAQTIADHGGIALNYMQVTRLTKDGAGKLNGVHCTDTLTDKQYALRAKAIVNATGVFVDDIMQMDEPGAGKTIAVSQGVHLVVDTKFNPSPVALMIPETSDGRVLFAVPWHNKLVIGTTDTPVANASLEPVALEKEIEFILSTASNYLLQAPERKDVLSVFAGLRPLAAPTQQQATKELSRSHKIMVSPSQLFTMIGGKWTTYRRMGEDMLNRMEKDLQWHPTISKTQHLKIHGYTEAIHDADPFYFYGSDAPMVKNKMQQHNECISETLGLYKAQVEWAVTNEMAVTVEDVLSRRTRCLLLDAAASLKVAPKVARIMATLLEKDEKWVTTQIHQFNTIANGYLLK